MARNPSSKRGSLVPFYAILGVVALVGAGVLLYQMRGGGAKAATAPVPVVIDPAELSRVQGISLGRADAPVVLYEFADFQCPACGQYASMVAPLIKERLVETGKVRYVYYDFPLIGLHPNAFLSSRAGRCANEQGKFWPYHDVLYGRQPTWAAMSDPTDFFVELSGEVGLDEGAFESCLRSDRFAEEVTRSLRLGESLGVQGTPSFFINGKRIDNPPTFSELERLVEQEMGQGAAAAAPAAAGPAPVTGDSAR